MRARIFRRAGLLGIVGVALVAALVATMVWGDRPGPEPARITILASSELGDLRPLLDDFAGRHRIRVELRLMDTSRATEMIARGQADGDYDAVWLASDRELQVSGSGAQHLGKGVVVMSSPVLLGLREPIARELGWTDGQVTWKQIADAARGHRFTFGMSSPESAFSGQSAVLAAATGLSGAIDSLSDHDIYSAAGGLRSIHTAQTLTAPTTASLTASFLQARAGTVDGLFTYESEIVRLNASGRLKERLIPIRPRDGVVTAKYTLHPLLKPRTAKAADDISRLTQYLLTRDAQRQIVQRTYRRPISPGVDLPPVLGGTEPNLLDVPKDQAVIRRLVEVYLGRYRYATRTLFLLDASGSMHGERIDELRKAASALAGARAVSAPNPQTGDEQAVLLPFASAPGRPVVIELSSAHPASGLRSVRGELDRLEPRGGTAIYDALIVGYRELARLATGDPDRIVSVVLLTDGASNRGRSLADFLRYHDALAPELRAMPVYPVLVDGADETQMRGLADHTGGRILDARQTGLVSAFLTFRAQQ